MRIAQIVCSFPPYKGGMGKVAFDYAEALQKHGDEVVVFTPKYNSKKTSYPFEVKKLFPFLKYGNAAFLPQLFFYLLFGKFDIVHLHYPFFGSMEMFFLIKKLFPKKFKLVIHYHMQVTGLAWYLEILRLPAKLIEKSLFKNADKITCASIDYLRNTNEEIYKLNSEKLFEIPFGVDTEVYTFSKQKKKQILFVGGMDKAHYFKGVRILLEAFSKLKNDYNLVLIGSGELMSDYKKYAEELDISKKVSFAGNLNNKELIKAYQESSLLVLPSINKCEAFGLVLLEAMSCGTAVIASDLFGVRKVFHDKQEGYYVKAGSVQALEEKLIQATTEQDKLLEMGEKGRKLVTNTYSSLVINKKLIDFYKSIL